MGFANDLKVGEDYEKFVMGFLNEALKLGLEKNQERMDTDLVSENLRIEVKFDRQMRKTLNLFIEYGSNGKPSGILKDEELDYFIYGDYEGMWVFNAKKLREEVELSLMDKRYRTVKGGDGWKSSGMLIPHKDADKIANKYYDFE